MRNAVKTVVFLVVLGGLFMFIGLVLGGTTGLTIGLALGLAFVGGSYWFSDTLAIKAARAAPVSREELPQVYEIVEELTQKAGMPMPRIYLSPDSQPNAFATGRSGALQDRHSVNGRTRSASPKRSTTSRSCASAFSART